MYVVTVEFVVVAEHVATFGQAMLENARQSRDDEPGCRQFDVSSPPADASIFFLYEVYDDRAAFDAHLASAHFKAFDAQVAPWVASKVVATYERLAPS